MIFVAGRCNLLLASRIASRLKVNLNIFPSKKTDAGAHCIFKGYELQNQEVFIFFGGDDDMHSCINQYFLEICIFSKNCASKGAKRIVLIIPYLPYSRQDKKDVGKGPIAAKLIADMLVLSGASQIVVLDLHCPEIQGFFKIPIINLSPKEIFIEYLQANVFCGKKATNFIFVAPDAGGVQRCKAIANFFKMKYTFLHKERSISCNISDMILVGDLSGKNTIIVDDIADSCDTILNASQKLRSAGALSVIAMITYPIFSKNIIEKLIFLDKIITLDTFQPLTHEKIIYLDSSNFFSDLILRISNQNTT